MLNPNGKPPYPDWAAPYAAMWVDGQWIAQFTSEYAARMALKVMQSNPDAPRLDVAPLPYSNSIWYVGVAD